MSAYYILTAFDWQPFDDLVSNPASSAHATLAKGLIATGMIKAEALAVRPEFEDLFGESIRPLLLADEWYDGAGQDDDMTRGKLLDAVFNPKDPLWCYPTRGEFAVLWEIVQLILGTIEVDGDEPDDDEWHHREVPGAVPRTRELQWFGNRPFRCRGWDGAAQTQREFERRYKRRPYSIHAPGEVGLLKADIAGAADECRHLPFGELREEYESLARQIDKAVLLGHALYVKQAEPKDLRTTPSEQMLERMLEEVGIHVGPPKKKTYLNPYFNELQCGDPKNLTFGAKSLEKDFSTLGEDCEMLGPQGNKSFCYQLCLAKCTWIVYHWHFGFRTSLRPQEVIEKGVALAIKYFAVVDERLRAADTRSTAEVAWFEPYAQTLLLATLSGRTRERTLLSDYLPARLFQEMTAPRGDAALAGVLLLIASSLRSSPIDAVPLVKRLQKSRKARLKLLLQAWRALESRDRTEFAVALTESTVSFAKTTSDDQPRNAVALLESILAGLAYERGWSDLSFQSPIAARLVTRPSLEMD
ncbi:MAG TPA: hypothetical protein VGN42_06110 [Pirellulales bacterium]|jgi:hypothetical protein|nr:hypothetical protein [Pirellulales bacterium]